MIYVLGSNDLSIYVAHKIKEANINVCILTNKIQATQDKRITIREDGKFQKKQTSLEVQNIPQEDATFLIITAPIQDIKTELTTIPKSKLINAKIICLTGYDNNHSINKLFNKNIELAYTNIYFSKPAESINTLGGTPELIAPNSTSQEFIDLFKTIGFTTHITQTQDAAFWQWFSPFAILYLLFNAHKKNSIDLLKDQHLRQTIENLATELAAISKHPIKESTIASIFSAPQNAYYPFSFAQINFIKEVITNQQSNKNELNKLIKTIYNKKLI